MQNRTVILVGAFVVVVAAIAFVALMTSESTDTGKVRVVQASAVDWQLLNPLRGDASPRAGTLWGDRGKPVPCGFLVKFVDGFSSPPHIHPVTYRGVVVSGLVHNDVPTAKEQWLPPGTFWTQPAGEVHITAAKGSENVAYIEIERGPYLVHPAKDAFDPPETPIKIEPAAMPWTDPDGGPAADGALKVATLPGNPGNDELVRTLVELPAGRQLVLRADGPALHVIVIAGRAVHHAPDRTEPATLPPGSYFGSDGKVTHHVACEAEAACLLYVRSNGKADVEARGP